MEGSGVRREKRLLARALTAAHASRALLGVQSLMHRHGYVRVVNYHGTSPANAALLEEHLRLYATHFGPVTQDDLDSFFDRGTWAAPKPGLVISFDDGLRSHYDVAAPLLEKHGFTGWFFVPPAFVDAPVDEQQAFARDHAIDRSDGPTDGRLAMSWDEVRTLAAQHVVGCHTRSHQRMRASVPSAVVEDEIVASRGDLEARLGRRVEAFCWVGGEEDAYSAEAADAVRRAGYRYGFMSNDAPVLPGTDPLQIHRTNIEASWPVEVVRFQLSGAMDLLSLPTRTRVNRLTSR